MVVGLMVAGQSEPVEDSCAEACPACFDKLSMTPILIYVTLKNEAPSSPCIPALLIGEDPSLSLRMTNYLMLPLPLPHPVHGSAARIVGSVS
jgi:hypothetical protein